MVKIYAIKIIFKSHAHRIWKWFQWHIFLVFTIIFISKLVSVEMASHLGIQNEIQTVWIVVIFFFPFNCLQLRKQFFSCSKKMFFLSFEDIKKSYQIFKPNFDLRQTVKITWFIHWFSWCWWHKRSTLFISRFNSSIFVTLYIVSLIWNLLLTFNWWQGRDSPFIECITTGINWNKWKVSK